MTVITISKDKEGIYKEINCIGHAGFLRKGKDIVCAAISILTINLINSLESICEQPPRVVTNESEGLIHCILQDEPNEKAIILLKSYELGICGVEKQYPRYCKVEIKEV